MRHFVETLKRLYEDGRIDEKKIFELFVNGKITDEEKWFVLKPFETSEVE